MQRNMSTLIYYCFLSWFECAKFSLLFTKSIYIEVEETFLILLFIKYIMHIKLKSLYFDLYFESILYSLA